MSELTGVGFPLPTSDMFYGREHLGISFIYNHPDVMKITDDVFFSLFQTDVALIQVLLVGDAAQAEASVPGR